MKNKKSIIVIIILILITIMLYYALTERTKPIYKLIYYKDVNTKTTNRINIYKNKVVIIKDKNCNIDNCDKSKTTTNTYYYSKNNMQNLKTYIKRKYPSSRYKPLNVYESKLDEIENSKINSIMLGEYYFEISYVDYQYRLEYSKNDSTTYEVYFNEDNMILVKKLYIKDYSIIKIDSYILGFSEENKKILYNYIKQEAKKNDNNTYTWYVQTYKLMDQ